MMTSSRKNNYADLQHDEAQQGAHKRRRLDWTAGESTSSGALSIKDENDRYGGQTTPHSFEAHLRDVSTFRAVARDAQSLDRWAEFDAEDDSPPSADVIRDSSNTKSGAQAAVNEIESSNSADDRHNRRAEDADNASQLSQLQLPSKPLVPYKSWPAEYEEFFINFIARDAELRSFMKLGSTPANTVTASLQRFRNLVGDVVLIKTLMKKITRLRRIHQDLFKGLTQTAQSTPTSTWSGSDLKRLAYCDGSHKTPWLRMLHDRVFVGDRIDTGHQSKHPRQSNSQQPIGTRPLKPSGSGPSTQAPQPSSSRPKVTKASLSGQNGSRTAAAAAASSSALPLPSPYQPETASRDARLARFEAQLKDQTQELALLRKQNEEQSRMLAQQTKLLEQQAARTDRSERMAEAEAQVTARQTESLERIERHIASLVASID